MALKQCESGQKSWKEYRSSTEQKTGLMQVIISRYISRAALLAGRPALEMQNGICSFRISTKQSHVQSPRTYDTQEQEKTDS